MEILVNLLHDQIVVYIVRMYGYAKFLLAVKTQVCQNFVLHDTT